MKRGRGRVRVVVEVGREIREEREEGELGRAESDFMVIFLW